MEQEHFSTIRLCTFADRDPWFRRDGTGHNKVGFISKSDEVIYPVRRHFVRVPLATLRKRMGSVEMWTHERHVSEEQERQIETFFAQNVLNPLLMTKGINLIATAEDLRWFEHPIRLPVLSPIDSAEHKQRWSELISILKIGDSIFTVDQGSRISRAIASVDLGTWSHCGFYSGDGRILEAITQGVVERSIAAYEKPRYRIGVYRIPELTATKANSLIESARTQIGSQYGWTTIGRLAIQKVLRVRLDLSKPKNISPNAAAAMFAGILIHLV